MKNLLLFALICCVAGVYGQQIDKSKYEKSQVAPKFGNMVNEYQNSDKMIKTERKKFTPPVTNKDVAVVNPIEIGQAGNTWGFAYNRFNYVWVANEINTVSLIHRMLPDPGTGYLAFDYSTDGGETWTINEQVYDATLTDAYNARYPQGLIYNPPGNTDPDNAYVHYFAPTLDGSNTAGDLNWGGYAWGCKQLTDGSEPTQTNQPSTGDFHQFLPSGFEVTQLGEVWVIDPEEVDDGAGTHEFTGNLIIGHGVWNQEAGNFEYGFEHFPTDVGDDLIINDAKVAFAPDGMTGWIVTMTELSEPIPQTTIHPVLYRTEDGGETWEEEPIEVQLGGEDGIQNIVNFIPDEILEWYFDPDPVPPRDEIDYFMGYHVDIAVDAWGNPHLCGLVAIADADAGTWNHSEGVMAEFHLWSEDDGETWQGEKLWDQKRYDAEWTVGSSTVNMYNRPQVGTSSDGAVVFFSWLDTDIEEVEDNSQPDIYFADFQPAFDVYGEAENVTAFSAAMWTATWGAMSRYAFTEISGEGYSLTIPWVYQVMTDDDPGLPVQFYYIGDFVKEYYPPTDIDNPEINPVSSVSQNYPNPSTGETYIRINLVQENNIQLAIYNLTGQMVKTIDFGTMTNGAHELKINTKDLDQGLYFYTVKAGNNEVTRKMIVQ